jgi:glycosyltransferase involved in cell wall biosynthesis
MSSLDISIIVPAFNEEPNIAPLYRAIVGVPELSKLSFEILVVDDGSSDGTFDAARELAERDHRVRVLKFRHNCGQTSAMAAGIEHARGPILVTMDADLQNDPADIPALLGKIAEGYDIVVGWRKNRQDNLGTRVLPSVIANWLIGHVTGVPIKDNGCSLKAYRADLIKGIPLYSEMHRFIPAMASTAGARIAQLPVRHHARKFGVSKYGMSRVYKVLLDLLAIKTVLIMASRPLFALTGATIVAMILCVSSALYEAVLYGLSEPEFSVVGLTLSLLFGVLSVFLISLGLLAQLVYRTGNLKTVDLSALTVSVMGPERDSDTKSRFQ